MIDYYAALGVSHDATQDEVRRAWRSVARGSHPDLNPDDVEAKRRFRLASEAYAALSDLDRRQAYDIALRMRVAVQCPKCSRPKLPTHPICVWCGMRIYQAEQERLRAEKRRARVEKERDRLRANRPVIGDAAWHAVQERLEEVYGESVDPWGYIGEFSVPSSDDLLEAILSDSALRVLRGRLRPQDLTVVMTITPDGRIELGGETVETLQEIHKNLERGNKLLSHVKRFLGWG